VVIWLEQGHKRVLVVVAESENEVGGKKDVSCPVRGQFT